MNSALGIYPDNVPRGRSPFLLPQSVEIPSNGFTVACSSEKRARANHVGLLTPFALRPMEARVTAQADDVLGSDLFNLLLPNIRLDHSNRVSAAHSAHATIAHLHGMIERGLSRSCGLSADLQDPFLGEL